MSDFYTFVVDLRPFGGGSPISYRYDKAQLVAGQDDIEQGEMIGLIHDNDDGTDRVLAVRFVRTGTGMGEDAASGKFAGIARESAKGIHRLGNQAALNLTELNVFSTGVHNLVGHSGDSFTHGVAVYMDGTSTIGVTVTQGTGGVQVGTVHLPNSGAIVGDGSKRVPVLIDEFTVTPA